MAAAESLRRGTHTQLTRLRTHFESFMRCVGDGPAAELGTVSCVWRRHIYIYTNSCHRIEQQQTGLYVNSVLYTVPQRSRTDCAYAARRQRARVRGFRHAGRHRKGAHSLRTHAQPFMCCSTPIIITHRHECVIPVPALQLRVRIS